MLFTLVIYVSRFHFDLMVKLLFAAVIIPVVQKQHQLLVTLLLCNAAAMEVTCYFFYMNS